MRPAPIWRVPDDLRKTLIQGAGVWEDDRWSPIVLMAMSAGICEDEQAPITWRIAVDLSDESFDTVKRRLQRLGIAPGGYGLGEHIKGVIGECDAALATRLRVDDCDSGVCVVDVESPDDCRAAIEVFWKVVFEN